MRSSLTLFCLLLAAPATAGELPGEAGPCLDCHNPELTARYPDIPVIAGLPEIVIANALYDFRGSARPCRKASCAKAGQCPERDMCDIARTLNDAEMDGLARYFSDRSFHPAVADFDPELAALGREIHDRYCEDCHSGGGAEPLDEASILTGQSGNYLRNAMRDYRGGQRLGEAMMLGRFSALSEAQLDALAHFYASAGEPDAQP